MNKKLSWLLVPLLLLGACRPAAPADKNQNAPAAKAAVAAPTEEELAQSLFQLPDTFRNQDDKPMLLSDFKGKPTVIAMIFTHCAFVCPRLTADIRQMEQHLGPEAGKVHFVLVSFDAARDLPARLKKYAADQQLDANFTLLHGSESAVRNLGVLLDVQFEKDEDGNFAHSNIITVMDPYGVVRYRKEGLGQDHTQTLAEIKKYL